MTFWFTPIWTWISHKYSLTAVCICEHTEHWTCLTLVLCFSAQDIQAMYVWRNTGVRSRNHICSGKAANITYFCVCACLCVLVSESVGICLCVCRLTYACAVLSEGLAGSTIFSTLSHKRHGSLKKVTEHKKCVLILSTNFVWNISHSKKNSTRYWHKCQNVFM